MQQILDDRSHISARCWDEQSTGFSGVCGRLDHTDPSVEHHFSAGQHFFLISTGVAPLTMHEHKEQQLGARKIDKSNGALWCVCECLLQQSDAKPNALIYCPMADLSHPSRIMMDASH